MNSDLNNVFALIVAAFLCWILLRVFAQLVPAAVALYFVVMRWLRPKPPRKYVPRPPQYHKDFDEPI